MKGTRHFLFFVLVVSVSVEAWWKPAPGASWDYQIGGMNTNRDVQVYFVDTEGTDASAIQSLKSKGKRFSCYLSAGSTESWRGDINRFPQSIRGNDYPGWPGEKFIDIRQTAILEPIFRDRLATAVSKQCDGIEWDNVDVWAANSGFPLTRADGLSFLRWLSDLTHSYDLAVGLKNDGELVLDVVNIFDFAVVEECGQGKACSEYLPFVNENKPVFAVEYSGSCSGVPPEIEGLVRDKDVTPNGIFIQCKTYPSGPAAAPTRPDSGSTVTTRPAPTTNRPVPTTTRPAPTTTRPAPTTTRPAPTTTIPPVPTITTRPAPTTTRPAPTTTRPAPTTTRPAPTTTRPAPPTSTIPPVPTVTRPAPTTKPGKSGKIEYQVNFQREDPEDWASNGEIEQFQGKQTLHLTFHTDKTKDDESGEKKVKLTPSPSKTLFYSIYFGDGYDFNNGGKIPGLIGGKGTTTCKREGWGARFMWKKQGALVSNLYDQSGGTCGKELATGFTLKTGQWHDILEQVQVNTPGNADGILRVWVNGRQVLNRENIQFRGSVASSVAQIDSLHFTTFYRGSDSPSTTSHLYFADFTVCSGLTDCGPLSSSQQGVQDDSASSIGSSSSSGLSGGAIAGIVVGVVVGVVVLAAVIVYVIKSQSSTRNNSVALYS